MELTLNKIKLPKLYEQFPKTVGQDYKTQFTLHAINKLTINQLHHLIYKLEVETEATFSKDIQLTSPNFTILNKTHPKLPP